MPFSPVIPSPSLLAASDPAPFPALVLLSVPWDVTSSAGSGSSRGPEAMIAASTQLDFFDPWAPGAWRRGIATLPPRPDILALNDSLRPLARRLIEAQEAGETPDASDLATINSASARLSSDIEQTASAHLAAGQIVGLVGGDHSSPLGLLKALSSTPLGILHLDAHCDLRPAYEGFTQSHASIMYNALQEIPQIEKLVQVGVRDFSEAEYTFALSHPKISLFPDLALSERLFSGTPWSTLCDEIVDSLPQNVYISFDIDFLSPSLCPSTGTPVPGGRSFAEATFLLRRVVDSGRSIVGFDLCEVAPSPSPSATNSPSPETYSLDASVGARILFALCGQTLR